jgi:tetratricopeptide (TPR) repeat protein
MEACGELARTLETMGDRHGAAGAWVAFGMHQQAHERFCDATRAFGYAIENKTDCLRALINIGKCHLALEQPREAVQHLRVAVSVDPEQPSAHIMLGQALHAIGDRNEGWREFEWLCHPHSAAFRHFERPVWDGTRGVGKRILLWSDTGQDLKDALFFLRYATTVRQLVGFVVVECPPALAARGFSGPKGIDMIDLVYYTPAWPWGDAKTAHGHRGCGSRPTRCRSRADTRSISG